MDRDGFSRPMAFSTTWQIAMAFVAGGSQWKKAKWWLFPKDILMVLNGWLISMDDGSQRLMAFSTRWILMAFFDGWWWWFWTDGTDGSQGMDGFLYLKDSDGFSLWMVVDWFSRWMVIDRWLLLKDRWLFWMEGSGELAFLPFLMALLVSCGASSLSPWSPSSWWIFHWKWMAHKCLVALDSSLHKQS